MEMVQQDEVPGATSSATNVSMVVSADLLSGERAEMNILEINKELRSQLAESNQQFRDLKEKFLITQATAYSLANQLKKYKCEEYKDIIDSVLRDELQFVEKLAEKLRQAEELGQYKALVHSQARELTQLREKLQEGRDASRSLNQHFKALLAPDDLEKSQGQDLREQLAEGHRLAEHLVHKLSPDLFTENQNDHEEEEGKAPVPPRQHDMSNYYLHSEVSFLALEEEKVCSTQDVAKDDSNSKWDETSLGFLEQRNDLEEVKGQETIDPRHRLHLHDVCLCGVGHCVALLRAGTSGMGVLGMLNKGKTQIVPTETPSPLAPNQADCPQGTWSGDLSHHLSEVQASQAQLEPSTLAPNCLRPQLDQGFYYGNDLARRGPPSTTCSFAANADSGNQWPFQELVLEPSLGMKNPPELEDDALEGSADNTQGRQVNGHIHASSVLKPKIIKRKLPLSKWRLACRFPGLQA
ncbi:PREDICTED: neuroblastoma breakpoint family member 4-like [Cercocebus atys]|uniref:neuroblastoma breakpoint family member 4-like n=1 Tax=Cercocebus atys TaxID=9531 RepID=UPI0005F48426|nr:PREDICTED: neuroblastoma breakpoint family member 4-like [Cercocebus atys]